MSKDFWDKRYLEREFAYGIEPNKFYKEQIKNLKPGKALFPGEGEGRNCVYAAALGWQVDAVDFSAAAKEKALSLAKKNNVNINYTVAELNDYEFIENFYDLIVLIFLHLPEALRNNIHSKSQIALKKGGTLIIEAFNKNQVNNNSGGPKDIEILYDIDFLSDSFTQLKTKLIENNIIYLDEGNFHKGKADVTRFVGIRL